MSQKRVQLTTITNNNNLPTPLGPPAPIPSTSSDHNSARRSSFSGSDNHRRPSLTDGQQQQRQSNGHLAKMTLNRASSSDKLNDRLSDPGTKNPTNSSSKKDGGGDKDKKDDEKVSEAKTFRFQLKLNQPTADTFAEYYFDELVKDTKKKKKSKIGSQSGHGLGVPGKDPFGDDDNDDDVKKLAQKMEEKYGNPSGKKKRRSAWEDYVDKGQGYDESDSFIDNDEAYDELIPSSLTTKHGGFYVNIGTLEFKPVSLSSDEDDGNDVNGNDSGSNCSAGGQQRPKKSKVQRREYPPVLKHKSKKGSVSSSVTSGQSSGLNSSNDPLRKKKKFSSLKNQAMEKRAKLAASIKSGMESSGVGSPAPSGVNSPSTPTTGQPPTPIPQSGHKESGQGSKPQPILVDLENEDEDDLVVKRRKTAVINDDDEDMDNAPPMDEDVPCRQSVIDVIESVARGPSQLAVDKMTADKMNAAEKLSSERMASVKQDPRPTMIGDHKTPSADANKLIRPSGLSSSQPSKPRPTSLPMSTNEGMVSRLMSNLPNSPSEQLKALSASLLSSRENPVVTPSGHQHPSATGHHHHHSNASGHQQQRSSPMPQSVQRSKTPPASLLNAKSVSSYINSQRMKAEMPTTATSNVSKSQRSVTPHASVAGKPSSIVDSNNGTRSVPGKVGGTSDPTSLLDQVISTSLLGYGQSSKTHGCSSSQGDLKQPQPAHQSKAKALSQGHHQHHSSSSMQRTLSGSDVGTSKMTAAVASSHIMDALIQEQFNSLRSSGDPSPDGHSHTKIIKYKDHHRVPNLSSKTPPLAPTPKAQSPMPVPHGGHSSNAGHGSSGGKSTPPTTASGIHRQHMTSDRTPSSSKQRPGPLSKKMVAMANAPVSSQAGMFNPTPSTQGRESFELYQKLMMSMGQYGQQQPNVPISINPIIGQASGSHSSGHRTTNHSIEALVSPTVSNSSSVSVIKPSAKVASSVQQQQHLAPNNLFSNHNLYMNSQQQQYKK